MASLSIKQWPAEQTPREFQAVVASLPPGKWIVEVSPGWGGMSAYPTPEIGFTDHRGTAWIRRGNGKLEEIDESAIEHFGIGRPFGQTDLKPPGEP